MNSSLYAIIGLLLGVGTRHNYWSFYAPEAFQSAGEFGPKQSKTDIKRTLKTTRKF